MCLFLIYFNISFLYYIRCWQFPPKMVSQTLAQHLNIFLFYIILCVGRSPKNVLPDFSTTHKYLFNIIIYFSYIFLYIFFMYFSQICSNVDPKSSWKLQISWISNENLLRRTKRVRAFKEKIPLLKLIKTCPFPYKS